MTRIASWPLWLQLLFSVPHIIVAVALIVWTPKSSKARRLAAIFFVYMMALYFVLR
ncbi:MAG: hypothetical protein LAO06_04650 [Acidobacteriia bacterium]|nr:hypothetical protein [Terriglobia bacterium]